MQKLNDKQKTALCALAIAGLFLLFCLKQFNIFDTDNYWQLVHGRLMLTEGLYPSDEPLTWHEGWSFMYPQWLSVLIQTVIYDTFGLSAMNLWYRFVQVIGIFFIWKTLKDLLNDSLVPAFMSLAVFAFFYNGLFSTRPFVLSYTLMAAEMFCLERYAKEEKKWLIAIPVISIIWINVHNSLWAFVLILTLPVIAEWVILKYLHKEIKYSAFPVILADVAACLTALINPYGINAILYLPRSSGAVKTAGSWISELKTTTINDGGVYVIGILVAVLLCEIFTKDKARPSLRHWFLFFGTFLLAMMHLRNIGVFIVCCTPLVGFYAKKVFPDIKSKALDKGFVLSLPLFLVLFGGISAIAYASEKDNNGLLDLDAIEYITDHYDTDTKIFNSINDGGILELNGYKTYIDPRLEVHTKDLNNKEDILEEYNSLLDGSLYPGDVADKYDPDVFVISKDCLQTMYQYLLHHPDRYKLAYDGEIDAIFETIR